MKTAKVFIAMLLASCAAIALPMSVVHALDQPIFSVTTGERGTLPAGTGPLSAPREGAAVVRAYKDALAKSCAGLGGRIEFQEPFVTAVDLNADRMPDLLMSSARTNCVGAFSYDSGTAGHGVRWAVSRTDGSYTVGDTHLRKAAVEETHRNGYQVTFHYHGSACGKVGVADCRELGRFDKDGQWQTIAWSDGRTGSGQVMAQAATAASQSKAASQDGLFNFDTLGGFSSSHGPYDHNGSTMKLAFEYGLIVYEQPKDSLAGIAQKGTILFRGDPFTEGGRLRGMAVAFKRGCPPAEYEVTGTYSRDRRTVTLSGAGPVRDGCRVIGHSMTSPHAKLVFKSMMSD